MSKFAVGDKVRCIRNIGVARTLTCGEVYTVTGVFPLDRLTLAETNPEENFFESRFERINPCAEIPLSAEPDWKMRYEHMKRIYKLVKSDLDAALQREGEFVKREEERVASAKDLREMYDRLEEDLRKLFAAKTCEKDGWNETAWGAATRLAAAHKLLDRHTFVGSTYNWNRQGLTWEEAARDLFNYILQARGEKPLPKDAKLLPSRFNGAKAKLFLDGKEIAVFENVTYSPMPEFARGLSRAYPPYHTPPKQPENGCPDKLEPCSGCTEGCSHPDHKK